MRDISDMKPRMLSMVEYQEWCLKKDNKANRNGWIPRTPLLIERKVDNRLSGNSLYWLNSPEGVVNIEDNYGKNFVVWTGYPNKSQQYFYKGR